MSIRRGLAKDIAVEFRKNAPAKHAKCKSHGEISLFRHLCDALATKGSGYINIEEFHGSKGIVSYKGKPPFTRSRPKCEISDIALITFSRNPALQVRLSFLQAKYERDWKYQREVGGSFAEKNIEQWCLLANRPLITGLGNMSKHLPKNILRDALLESVGTFGVFWEKGPDIFDMFYSTANNLAVHIPPPKDTIKEGYISGKLQPKAFSRESLEGTYAEAIACRTLESFLEALMLLKIGTPIDITADQHGCIASHRRPPGIE